MNLVQASTIQEVYFRAEGTKSSTGWGVANRSKQGVYHKTNRYNKKVGQLANVDKRLRGMRQNKATTPNYTFS